MAGGNQTFSCLLPSSSGGASVSLRPGSVSASASRSTDVARTTLPPPLCFSEPLLSRSLYFGPLHTSLFLSVFQRLWFPPFGLYMLHFAFLFKGRIPPPVVVGRERSLSSNFCLFSPSFIHVFIHFCHFFKLFSPSLLLTSAGVPQKNKKSLL